MDGRTDGRTERTNERTNERTEQRSVTVLAAVMFTWIMTGVRPTVMTLDTTPLVTDALILWTESNTGCPSITTSSPGDNRRVNLSITYQNTGFLKVMRLDKFNHNKSTKQFRFVETQNFDNYEYGIKQLQRQSTRSFSSQIH